MDMGADSGGNSSVKVKFRPSDRDTYAMHLVQHAEHGFTVGCDKAVPVPAVKQGCMAVSYFITYFRCHSRMVSHYPYFNDIAVRNVHCNYIFSFLPQNISLADASCENPVIQTNPYLRTIPCCLAVDSFEGFLPLNVHIVDFPALETGIPDIS